MSVCFQQCIVVILLTSFPACHLVIRLSTASCAFCRNKYPKDISLSLWFWRYEHFVFQAKTEACQSPQAISETHLKNHVASEVIRHTRQQDNLHMCYCTGHPILPSRSPNSSVLVTLHIVLYTCLNVSILEYHCPHFYDISCCNYIKYLIILI